MNSQKGSILVIVLAIIAFLSLSVAGCFLWQTRQLVNQAAVSRETANWKTYDTNLGMTLKLPPLWFFHPKQLETGGYTVTISYPIDNPSPQSYDPNGQKANIYIWSQHKHGKEGLEEKAQSYLRPPPNIKNIEPTKIISHIKIDGQNALILGDKGTRGNFVLVDNNDMFYGIRLGLALDTTLEEKTELRTVFDKILATIRFTNETQNWKIYTSKNMSFKYPFHWLADDSKIKDPVGEYLLTFTTKSNYAPETEKRLFNDLYDYLKMPHKIEETFIDGQLALLYLPRAGSEHIFDATFFSNDQRQILSLTLETPKDGSKIEEGQKLFDQILQTFKFTEN